MAHSPQEIRLMPSEQPRWVIIGAGFAGINLAKTLRRAPVQIVMLDRNNFHQFQPLLYQVATCGIEPDGIIYPIRKLFEKQSNLTFRMARVDRIRTADRTVETDTGSLTYDKLVIATGSSTNFFGNQGLERRASGMKDIREALQIRSRILFNLERAAATTDPAKREALTNFVVVGGGPAGVETAGALAEFKTHILRKDYPDLDPQLMKIFLIQSGNRILKSMSEQSSQRALRDLKQMGVEVLLHQRVQEYDGSNVRTDQGLEIPCRNLTWTAGVKGRFPEGLPSDQIQAGRIQVDGFLRIAGIDNVYIIGDVACVTEDAQSKGHPMVAPVAIQQGNLLGKNLLRELDGIPPVPFRYRDKGSLATIGKKRAVADLPGMRLQGFAAWLIWCFVHVMSLIGFRNRLLVLTHWVASYFTYEKGNRFITRNPEPKSD